MGSGGFFPIIEDRESSQGGSNAVATERRDGRDGGTVAALGLFPVASEMIERSCEGVHSDSAVPLEDSWVAITDEALLAEANQHLFAAFSSLGSTTQDGSLKAMKGSSDLEARVEWVDPSRDAGLGGVEEGEEFACLPRGFFKFSNCLGMPISGYEKEISSILRKLESQKGRGVKVLRGKRKSLSSSWLDKEIRRLECLVRRP